MVDAALPTLVLVHGAWHRKETWRLLIKELPEVDIRTLQLPSSAAVSCDRLGGLYDDAAVIRSTVEEVGRPCVVLAHSYGGAPTTQALPGTPWLRRVVYLCAWQLDVGDSLLSVLGGQVPDWMRESSAGGYYDMMSPQEIFYSDLQAEEASAAAAAMGPQSVSSFSQTLTRAVWRTETHTTHIYGELDPYVNAYQSFAARADKVRTIHSGHSPYLSRPAELAGMLREELAEAAGSDPTDPFARSKS